MTDAIPTSVVVVTYRREQVLVDTLRSILGQLPQDVELVVVDQTDRHPPEIEAQLAELTGDGRVVLHRVTPPSTTAARNFGLAHTSGEVVVFFDDDVLLEPGCFEAHRAAYRDEPRLGGVVGRVEHPDEPLAPRLYRMDDFGGESGTFNHTEPSPVETLNGANMSVRRAAVEQVGGFDPSYQGNGWREESDLAMRLLRAGWSLRFEPTAHLVHLASPSGGARAYGGDYYDAPTLYQNETIFFLKRFGYRRLPGLVVRLVRRGVLRKRVLTSGRAVARVRVLVTGVVRGIRYYRRPLDIRAAVRAD